MAGSSLVLRSICEEHTWHKILEKGREGNEILQKCPPIADIMEVIYWLISQGVGVDSAETCGR